MKTAALAFAIALLPCLSSAAIVTFTDRTTFVAAAGTVTTQDFESQTVGTNLQNATLDLGDFSLSVVSIFGGSFNRIDQSAFNAPNGSIFAGIGLGGGETMTLLFDSAITSFGADFGSLNDNVQRSQFEVLADILLAPILVGTIPSFFGFTSDTAFTSLTIRGLSPSDGFGIDNITYSVAAIPVPATLPLLAGGLGLLALWRRRTA